MDAKQVGRLYRIGAALVYGSGLVIAAAGIVIACGGCFTTSTFEKLGVTDAFVLNAAIDYAQKEVEAKGMTHLVNKDEINTIARAATKALEADKEFQGVMKTIVAKQAVQDEIAVRIKEIVDAGIAIPTNAPAK